MNATEIVYDNGAWWIALAIVTAGLADTRGRSRWVWFIWGLILGPLATAFLVIWGPADEIEAEE